MLDNVKKILEAYGLNIVSAARNNLAKKDIGSGPLANSLTHLVTEESDGSYLVTFLGEDYATFYDQGVQGAAPDKMPSGSKNRFNKAPLSPYHFLLVKYLYSFLASKLGQSFLLVKSLCP